MQTDIQLPAVLPRRRCEPYGTEGVAVLRGLRAVIVGNPIDRLILAGLLRVMRGHKRLTDTASEQSLE
jgi:hypothetical protein